MNYEKPTVFTLGPAEEVILGSRKIEDSPDGDFPLN